MSIETYIGLPGFHGSAALFAPMASACPEWAKFIPLDLPSDRPATYMELEEEIVGRLPSGAFCLLAESFSGPLAVRLAARTKATAVILSASFATSPLPRALRSLPWRALARLQPPKFTVRTALTGGDGHLADEVLNEMRALPATVLSSRMREIASVDVTPELRQVDCPLLYLQAAHDRVVPSRCWDEIRAERPDAVLKRISAPHLILQAEPAKSWSAIREFRSGEARR